LTSIRRNLLGGVLILGTLLVVACGLTELALPATPAPRSTLRPAGQSSQQVTKPIEFALLEDYDKGADLAEIALDFQLLQELEVDKLRTSIGWDDYEPVRSQYDFAWLQDFVSLAAEYEIKLRPYIAYTAPWAGVPGTDEHYWNNPPANEQDWYNFVFALATALEPFPNVLSYEIYNEENDSLWWDGTVEQYHATLKHAAQAIRTADPDAAVILGGLVYPDDDWLRALVEAGGAQFYDVTPFHAYLETWSEPGAVVENYLTSDSYRDYFLWWNNGVGQGEPIWINEMGFATTPGRSEEDQANWFARAVSTFLADPEVEQIGFYELKDLPRGSAVIGDSANYHLGISQVDRRPKLAFATVDLLTDLLDVGTLTTADAEAAITVTAGQAGELYHHLFLRPDGGQVLFVYDKTASPTIAITLAMPGRQAIRYGLDGGATPVADFAGTTLPGVTLTQGQVAIFLITP
jgi:polysaccharide biosynthesis protein PslG